MFYSEKIIDKTKTFNSSFAENCKKKNRERFFVSMTNVKVHDGTIRKNCSNMACLEGFPGESTFFLKRKVASQRNISIKDFGTMLFSKSVN